MNGSNHIQPKIKSHLIDSLGVIIDPPSDPVADTVGDGSRTVTTAGTRVQLSASSVPCKRVVIQAKEANTGKIYVGGSTVSSSSGLFIFPTQSLAFYVSDLNVIYIDSEINGEGVVYSYEV